MIQTDRFYGLLVVLTLLISSGCSVIEAPEAYPPVSRVPPPHPHPHPQPQPQPTQPRTPPRTVPKPVIHPTVPVVKPDEPEQGDNPYDDVPRRTVVKTEGSTEPQQATTISPAVKSLLAQAKASLLAHRTGSAISKLERALRIEPRNPLVWHQLAQAHYQDNKDASAISMAKKSNLYVASGSDTERSNWQLIKDAAKRSGNIKMLKEAIRYERNNPL